MRRATACAGSALLLVAATSVVLRFTADGSDATNPSTSSPGDAFTPLEPVGPAQVINGVPQGWRHDAEGAQAAAVAAVALTGKLATAGFITRSDVIRSIATAEYGPSLAAESAAQLAEMSIELGAAGVSVADVVWAEIPLRMRIVSADDTRAVVEVWAVLVIGVADEGAARQAWRTVTAEMAWEREDWRINGWQTRSGPTPALATAVEIASVDAVAEVTAWDPARGGS